MRPLGGDGHEGGSFINGIYVFMKDIPESSLLTPSEDTVGNDPSATQEGVSPELALTSVPSQLPYPGL